MDSSRIETLKNVLRDNPMDSFARYALGLEYASAKNYDEAREIYEELIVTDPNYAATYYQLGKVYEALGDDMSAKKIYEKGIFVTTSQSETHAREELQQALDELL